MIERNKLEDFVRRQMEIIQMKSALTNEFQKYNKELFERAKSVLQWKDDNLGQKFLEHKRRGHIHELRTSCLVLCFPDWDDELPTQYYIVSYDEIYSDDWKQKALEEQERKAQQALRDEQEAKEKAMLEQEKRERAEYERLRAKFG